MKPSTVKDDVDPLRRMKSVAELKDEIGRRGLFRLLMVPKIMIIIAFQRVESALRVSGLVDQFGAERVLLPVTWSSLAAMR